MIALYDYVQRVRAELRNGYFTYSGRAPVEAELAASVTQQAELGPAFD